MTNMQTYTRAEIKHFMSIKMRKIASINKKRKIGEREKRRLEKELEELKKEL